MYCMYEPARFMLCNLYLQNLQCIAELQMGLDFEFKQDANVSCHTLAQEVSADSMLYVQKQQPQQPQQLAILSTEVGRIVGTRGWQSGKGTRREEAWEKNASM